MKTEFESLLELDALTIAQYIEFGFRNTDTLECIAAMLALSED
jgi:hypothetical protein